MRTIVRLGGASCSGKSTILNLLNSGLGYLFAGSPIESLVGKSIGMAVPATLIEARDRSVSEVEWANGLMDKHNRTALAIEEPYVGSDFSAAFQGMDVLNVQIVLPYYMWAARRRFRFDNNRNVTAPWVQQGTREQYEDYARTIQRDCLRDTHFISVADYPVIEVAREDVVDLMLSGGEGFDYVPEENTDRSCPNDYHRALRVKGEWHGDEDFAHILDRRMDKTLPSDMTGMSVIDIGAAEGAFSFEAIARGASFVVSCERSKRRVNTLKNMRAFAEVPISTVELTIGTDPIPNFVAGYGGYDVALMLNVIRHLQNPEQRLREALALCKTLICETVIEDGDGATVGSPPMQSFSYGWMKRVGEDCGFTVEAMPRAIESDDRRGMFVFTRTDNKYEDRGYFS